MNMPWWGVLGGAMKGAEMLGSTVSDSVNALNSINRFRSDSNASDAIDSINGATDWNKLSQFQPDGYMSPEDKMKLNTLKQNQISTLQQKEAAPAAQQLADFATTGKPLDQMGFQKLNSPDNADSSGGLPSGFSLDAFTPQQKANPLIAKSISDFKTQQATQDTTAKLLSGEGTAQDLAKIATRPGESGQAMNALRQAKDAFLPATATDTETPESSQFMQDAIFVAERAPTIEDFQSGMGSVMEAHPTVKTKTVQDFVKDMAGEVKEKLKPEKPDKPVASATEEQLTERAINGDKIAQQVLDAMQKRKIETAKANRSIITNGQKEVAAARTHNLKINGLSDVENDALSRAIDNGLDPYKINSRTAQIYAQQEIKQPGRKWNELGATAAFERNAGVMNSKALLNTIDPLLDKLGQAGAVLGNAKLPGYNKAVNYLKEATGSADIVGFNNLRDDVVAEVERGLMGTGVLSDSKYNRAMKNINSAQSLPQLNAAIANTRIVIKARLESLANGPGAKQTATPSAKADSKPIAAAGVTVPKKGGGVYTSDGKGGWK